MSDLSSLVLNTRLWIWAGAGSLGLMILLSLLGNLIGPRIWGTSEATRTAGQVLLPLVFCLFLALGFAAVPLMVKVVIYGLDRVWGELDLIERSSNARMLAWLHRHHVHVVLGMWGVFLAGLAIAAPHMIRAIKKDPASPWYESWAPEAGRVPTGAMPPLDLQVRFAQHILLCRTEVRDGAARYLVTAELRPSRASVETEVGSSLDLGHLSFELLGYEPVHDRFVVLFFHGPDSTAKTLFELLVMASDGTMKYPSYAAPRDPSIERVITLQELQRLIAAVPMTPSTPVR